MVSSKQHAYARTAPSAGSPASMEFPEQIIDDDDQLPEALDHIKKAGTIGFDTEFVGEHSFHPELCLIQVATYERLMLIDPQAVKSLRGFWDLMVDGKVEVVVHAGREEIRQCIRAAGHPPLRCFDVQIAAGLIGLGYPLGHASLVNQLLGANLAKTETLTDWRTRPLTAQQIRYAFDDVRFLLPLHKKLSDKLARFERLDWVREECSRLSVIAADEAPANKERWRKVKGSSSLSPRQLAMLRELYAWRQEKAEQFNRPARTLIRDELMVDLVKRDPRSTADLQGMRGLGIARRDLDSLMSALERGKQSPKEAWPVAPERELDPPQISVLVDFLQVAVGHLALQMRLAPSMICTVADLRQLIKSAMEKKPPQRPWLLDEGWRKKHIRPLLEGILHGEFALRVGNLDAPAPLEFTQPTSG
jgi:ribonuclease D